LLQYNGATNRRVVMKEDRIAEALFAVAAALERIAEAMSRPPESPPLPLKRTVSRTQAATAWLVERFGEQREWPSQELFRRARADGISRDAVFEARALLELPKARKVTAGGQTRWVWWVPEGWTPPVEGEP
jgi:hypothetical protein